MLLPLDTEVPAFGFCLTTWPCGAVEFGSDFWVTWKPAFCSWLVAAFSVSPTTLGTLTDAGPADTNSLTVAFLASLVPNGGLVLITSPLCTLAEVLSTTDGTSPAWTISFCAWAWGWPTTFGTAMLPPLLEM